MRTCVYCGQESRFSLRRERGTMVRMKDRMRQSYILAEYAHRVLPIKPENAFRKFGGSEIPYITHSVSVMFRAMQHFGELFYEDDSIGCVCLLHDVPEDTLLPIQRIRDEIGSDVEAGVIFLTSYSKQFDLQEKRAIRKARDREYLRGIPALWQAVKLLDREDNLAGLDGAPMDFVKLYVDETRLLVADIGQSGPVIADRLLARCNELVK